MHVGALVLERVDAQVQPGRRVQALHQRPETIAKLRLERIDQPLRQVVAVQFHQVFGLDLAAALKPILFLLCQRAQQKVALGSKAQNGQPALQRPAAGLGQVGEQRLFAQHGVNGFGNSGAFTRAQALLTKMPRDHHVGGMIEFENLLEKLGTTV